MRGELLEVLSAVERLAARAERAALATVVSVRGSTYRRPGARLLVPEHGGWVGSISGGCLEDDVAEVGRGVIEAGEPRTVAYDLTADDEAVWGWGLGCNGAIEVFVEPAGRAAEVAAPLRRALEQDRPVGLVTVLEAAGAAVEPGARIVVHPDGRTEGSVGSAEVDRVLAEAAVAALRDGGTEVRALATSAGEVRAFVEVLEPAPRLLVCGAGHDAIPVVAFARSLGWTPIVVDDRKRFLSRDRFPEAAGFVHVERPEEAARGAGTDRRTFVVVMSHNYLRDLGYLSSFLGTGVPYIGCLGPRRRLDRLLGDLERRGIRPSAEDRAAIHGPAGLDLGAEGPEEIAWAIVAELLAVRRGRGGGPLRERAGPIHDRPEEAAEASR